MKRPTTIRCKDERCLRKPTPAESSSSRSCKLRAGTPSRTRSPSSARSRTAASCPVGKGFIRKPPKRVDYLLRYTRDFPLAVVEAKAAYKHAADGLQQAKDYAEMLGLKFAYATNGHEIIEFDYFTGLETTRRRLPDAGRALGSAIRPAAGSDDQQAADTPADAVQPRRRQGRALLPADRHQPRRRGHPQGQTARAAHAGDRHRQDRCRLPDLLEALERALEPHGRTPASRKILFLADRNILVDDPRTASSPRSATRGTRSKRARSVKSREMYFAIYQALAEDERRPGCSRSSRRTSST